MTPLLLLALAPGCMDYGVTTEAAPTPNTLEGTPILALSPTALDFGGDPEARSVRVDNAGDGLLLLYRMGLDSEGAFELTALGAQELEPGAWTTFTVTSLGGADATGAVELETNDPAQLLAVVPLQATHLDPALSVTPPVWDFGTVDVGDQASATVWIENTGTDTLTLEELAWSASSTELTLDAQLDLHGPLPWQVPPGAVLEASLVYAPTDTAPDDGTLTVSSDAPRDPIATVVASGSGHQPTCADTGTCTWTLYADEAMTSGPCVDDLIEVFLDGALLFTSPNDTAGCESPITFTASPGQLLSLDAVDYWGNCRGLEPVWIQEHESGQLTLLDPGRQDGCNGYPSGWTVFYGFDALIPTP